MQNESPNARQTVYPVTHHELGRGVAPMISVTRGMWGKSRPFKVAFSSICLQRPQLRLKGEKRVRLVESDRQ